MQTVIVNAAEDVSYHQGKTCARELVVPAVLGVIACHRVLQEIRTCVPATIT
ncbi:hypothetical protein MA16_Dca007175 [Dendrobium catenatum]|uniref:Uncharacterized protein n=1 Tax=Dendrobium catenatum TaxID=906689 RepID=A0A2I0W442_9ASPA|nr:hypothetical protein MA16_Dca007175 [Dendrobium catenatum]